MRVSRREVNFEGKYLRIVKKYFKTDAGQEGIWETVEMKDAYKRGIVLVVALTKEGEIIFERNWRVPPEAHVIEFPAGLTDKEGESEEDTARRELLEETGYVADKVICVISAPQSPALTSVKVTCFFAPEVRFVEGQRQGSAESIEVLKVPVQELGDFLLNLPNDTRIDLQVPGIIWILEQKEYIQYKSMLR